MTHSNEIASVMRQAIEAAYLAGFNASGEGYNGEYPFQDHGKDPEQDSAWLKDRENYVNKTIQAGRALLEELKGQEPQPMLYVKDVNGNFHEYTKEKGHTENCAALGDDCCLENHLPPSRVGVGENDYTSATQEPVAWRNAAIRVGEDLCSVGPFGYYDMTAEQWLDWALSVVTVHHQQPAQPKVWDAEGYDALCQQLELVTAERDALKAAQPKEPLTDEQIYAIGKELGLKCRLGGNPNIDIDYARAIEAAHGIKE